MVVASYISPESCEGRHEGQTIHKIFVKFLLVLESETNHGYCLSSGVSVVVQMVIYVLVLGDSAAESGFRQNS